MKGMFVVAAFVLTSATAPLSSARQRDRDNILAELRQIQSQLSQIQDTQATLAQAILDLSERAEQGQDSLRKTLADSKVAVERLEQDLSIISARVDETNGRIGNLRQEVVSMRQTQQPLVLPADVTTEGTGEAGDGPVASEGDAPPDPVAVVAAGPNVTDIYNQARIDYTQGRYSLAISGFEDVLANDRTGTLADNALYWIGESYLAQRQYVTAIESFDKVVRDHPNSNKRSDAYLKKGIALQSLDRRSEAMLMYELVIDQFPRSQHERIARSRLEELMRTTPPRD